MSADLPTPDPVPDVLPRPTPLGTPSARPPRNLRRKRPWMTRLLTGRHYDDEVVVYRHSHLVYWWPVWLFGYIAAVATYFGDRHMAIVPGGTMAAEQRQVDVPGEGPQERDVLILPVGKKLDTRKDAEGNPQIAQPTIYIAPHRTIGTVYLFVLLVVVVLTNITLRGLWSFLVLMTVVLLMIILYLAHAWGTIFHGLGQLSIYVNMGGYILISTVLLVLWVLNFFVLDRMTYMVFTPGQVRARVEIGGGEMCYDTTGMTVQKQRSDLFRHWALGLGSGDLIVFPAGVSHPIELPNVLRVSRVVREIEQMVKEKVVLTADSGAAR
jgi:hypothetical protein